MTWLYVIVGIVLSVCSIAIAVVAVIAEFYPWHWLYMRYGIRPPR